MSARFQGRGRLTTDITCWAQSRDDIEAVVLVGSFAREGAGMASDVDLVILTPNFAQLAAHPNWFLQLRPGSQLIHAMAWGPLLERRYRMRSGLQVDVGLVPRVWLSCHSIRAHNESSRWAHRALGLTRTPISCRRSARQQSRVGRPSCGHSSGPVDGADRKPTPFWPSSNRAQRSAGRLQQLGLRRPAQRPQLCHPARGRHRGIHDGQ